MSLLAVLSLKNRALIALITICSAVFGLLAVQSLRQELIPSIELPTLAIVSAYPGASPEVVENDVSTPIETALQTIDGLESTVSTSATSVSLVQATFAFGTDLGEAERDIERAISRISSVLPDDLDPDVVSLNLDDLPIMQIAASGARDQAALAASLRDVAVPALGDVDGVSSAGLVGAAAKQIAIRPDDDRLAEEGLTRQAISDTLDASGTLLPGGVITEGDQTLTVQSGAKLASADDIRSLPVVRQPATDPLTGEPSAPQLLIIGDVADVQLEDEPTTSIARVNGEDAISIAVGKRPDANTVEVSARVLAELDDVREALPDVDFTVVFDQAPFIEKSIETLAVEGALGLVFAVLVIFVFLMSVRSTLVTAISIPLSVLVTFIGMQAFGYSLNVLTLGALTISIGRVVDDSIVVIENIKRHYVAGANKVAAIVTAVREVAGAITASTVTTVVVFLPVAFVRDVVGEIFRPFALTVAIAMTASLVVALTIVPVLAFWFMRPSASGGDPTVHTEGQTFLQRAYAPVLRWTLRHSWVTLALAALVLVATGALAPLMKTNFLGDSEQNTMTVSQTLDEGASLERMDAAATRVEQTLLDMDDVETVQLNVGSTGSAVRDAFEGGADANFSITTNADADQVHLRQQITNAVEALQGVGTVTVAGQQSLGGSDIQVEVTGPSAATLDEAVDVIAAALDGREGLGSIRTGRTASLPYLAIVVDRVAAAEAGLSEAAVGGFVAATMLGDPVGSVEIDGTSVDVIVESSNLPATAAQLRALEVPTPNGPVALENLATVEERASVAQVTTSQGQRTSTVTITPDADDLQEAVASVREAIDEADLPSGTRASIGGVAEEQADAFQQLGLAMLAAILIVYIVMVATFKSLRQPLLLLVSVPFAATGAILLQIVTGIPLGVASLIGVLMLIGIVVTNAIVLVDLVNQYRARGWSTYDSVVAGSSLRLRPILMTALATILALTPMALGITGHGGFISQPLAIVVIGGLVSSTVLTLIVLPTLLNLVEGARERRHARRAPSGADVTVQADGTVQADEPIVASRVGVRASGELPPISPIRRRR